MTLSGLGFSIFAFMMTPVGALVSFVTMFAVVYTLRLRLIVLYERVTKIFLSLWTTLGKSDAIRHVKKYLEFRQWIGEKRKTSDLPQCYEAKSEDEKYNIKIKALHLMQMNWDSIELMERAYLASFENDELDYQKKLELRECIFNCLSQMIIKEYQKKSEITDRIFQDLFSKNAGIRNPENIILRKQISIFLHQRRPSVFLATFDIRNNQLSILPDYPGADQMSLIFPQGSQLSQSSLEVTANQISIWFYLGFGTQKISNYEDQGKLYDQIEQSYQKFLQEQIKPSPPDSEHTDIRRDPEDALLFLPNPIVEGKPTSPKQEKLSDDTHNSDLPRPGAR